MKFLDNLLVLANVGIGTSSPTSKLHILQDTVGTSAKGLSVNFNTIGEVFFIDDNGLAKYYGGGFTVAGSNAALNLISNGGVNPGLGFKYNNGSNDSGTLYGSGNSMFLSAAAFGIGGANFNPQARLHITGVDTTSGNHALKVENIAATNLLSITNDGFVTLGAVGGSARVRVNLGNSQSFDINATDYSTFSMSDGGTPWFTISPTTNNEATLASTGILDIRAGGANTLYARFSESAGGIGINTQNPTARLHIVGVNATSSSYSLTVENSALVNLLYVRNDGVSLFGSTVSIDGKDVTNYPISVVSTHATLTRLKFLNSGNTQTDIQIGNNNGTNSIYYGVNTAGNSFIDNRTGNLLFQNTGTTQMIFDNTGRLGIGSTAPSATLDVKGANSIVMSVKQLSSALPAMFQLINDNDTTSFSVVAHNSASATPNKVSMSTGHGKDFGITLGSSPAGTFRIAREDGYTVPTFFIDGTNERIGIGTASPTAKLHVLGVDATSSNYALKIQDSAATNLLFVRNDGQSKFGNGFTVLAGGTSASVTGNFPIYGGFGGSFEASRIGLTSDISIGGALQLGNSGFSKIYSDGNYGIIYSSTAGNTQHQFIGNITVSDGLTIDTVVSSPIANALHTLTGHVVIDDLAGSGTRYVTVDSTGKLIEGAAAAGSISKYQTTFTPGTVTDWGVNVANTITHGLGTLAVTVTAWDLTTGNVLYAQIGNRSTTTVDVTFRENPAGDVQIVIIG